MKRKKVRGRAKLKKSGGAPIVIVFLSRAGIKRPKKGK